MAQASNPFITSTVEAATAGGRTQARRLSSEGLSQLLSVPIEVTVRFGEVSMLVQEILRLGVGSMIELNKSIAEPVTILINGKIIARGEVVVVDGYYGVRITEIEGAGKRLSVAGEVEE